MKREVLQRCLDFQRILAKIIFELLFDLIRYGDIQMSDSITLTKKILLLGDPGVGKTSMIRKFVYDLFEDKYISTLGTKVTSKKLVYNYPTKNKTINMKFMIWDVMGQKDYEMFHQSAYMGSQGAILVCDITRNETLENIPTWLSGLFNVTGEIPIVIIGNKNDLITQRQFDHSDMSKIASTFGAPTLLTSPKTGDNVENAFMTLGQNVIQVDFNALEFKNDS